MMKLALMGTFTGKEDPLLTLLQRIRSLELTAPLIAAQINTIICFQQAYVRLCKGYLTKESDGVLHQITWPPQSPDLNPIEMV